MCVCPLWFVPSAHPLSCGRVPSASPPALLAFFPFISLQLHADLAPSPLPLPLFLSPPQYDWLVREKIADGALIAKWRKPGYENLCSMLAIQKGNHNFGTTSHCRVPLKKRAAQQVISLPSSLSPA